MNLESRGAGTVQTPKSQIDLKSIIENVSLVQLPSVLWKMNYDSNRAFLIFCTLSVCGNKKNSKSVVLTSLNNSAVTVNILLNSKPINIPTLKKTVGSLEELSVLLGKVDNLEICKNNLVNKDNCLVFCTESRDICTKCMELNEANSKSQDLTPILFNTDKAPISSHKIGTNSNSTDYTISNENSSKQCRLCGEYVENVIEMGKHEYKHFSSNDEKEFKCSICNQILDDTIIIINHYFKYHVAVKFIKCLECKRQFNTINSLKRHARDHGSVCLKCNLKFKNRSLCERHICNPSRLKKKKHYLCNICKVKYATSKLFKQHQKEHEIKVGKMYKCFVCTMKYKSKLHLNAHKRYCNMKHMRFACEICTERFSCTSQKVFHMNTKHIDYVEQK